jgi:hypothetical protein
MAGCRNASATGKGLGLMENETEYIIYFVKEREEYAFMSNFFPASFKLGGNVWLTSEHYYQANKFLGTNEIIFDKIKYANTPGKAKRIAKENRKDIRGDWLEINHTVMLQALRAKFGAHEDLRLRLLATGDAILVEFAPWGDTYWGVDSTLNGENHLGKLLMRVRSEIRECADQQQIQY